MASEKKADETAETQSKLATDVRYINENYNERSSMATDFKTLKINPEQKVNAAEGSGSNQMATAEKQAKNREWVKVRKCEEDTKNDISTPEVCFTENGEKLNILFWGLISQPTKPPLVDLMKTIIEKNTNSNLVVRIGEHTFDCHLIALRAYSQYFRNLKVESREIELPASKITPCGFHMFYMWILADHPIIQRDGIMELLQASLFLEVPELQAQCWQFFDDFQVITEYYAYYMFIEARKYNLVAVTEMMLRRITKFFLPLVSSQDFLDLPFGEVSELLSSSYIGVNNEAEVFMAGLFWLDYKWEERQQHQLPIMKCVRFSLLPPYFLVSLNKPDQHMTPQIQRCVESKEVKEMLERALNVSIWQLYATDGDQFNMDVNKPMHRIWVYDSACPYHEKRSSSNMSFVTYSGFVDYLDFLQSADPYHYETFEVVVAKEELTESVDEALSGRT